VTCGKPSTSKSGFGDQIYGIGHKMEIKFVNKFKCGLKSKLETTRGTKFTILARKNDSVRMISTTRFVDGIKYPCCQKIIMSNAKVLF